MRWVIFVLTCMTFVAPAAARKDDACVAVIGTNDLHGVIEPQVLKAAGKELRYGGVIALSGYVEVLRSEYGKRLVLLDGGDLYQGTMASNASLGKAVITAYNTLGYSASAIGNHEFDFGAGPTGGTDELAVVKQRIAEARFPFLAVNVFDKATHKPITWPNVKPSVLLDADGIKVGVLGVSTVETPKVTRPENVVDLEFRDPVPLVIAEARKLRAMGAKLVVLIGHLGGACGDLVDPYDLSSCEPGQELFELINALPKGTLDVAVGGHTHAYVAQWVNGVATIEAGARGRSFGWVQACARDDGGIDIERSKIMRPPTVCVDEWQDGGCKSRKEPVAIRPATFMNRAVPPTEAMNGAMAPYLAEVRAIYEKPLGVVLDKPLVRDPSPGLGEVVCAAIADAAKAPIAVQNRGGVRADLAAGALHYGEVFEVLPFDNKVAVVTLSGAQLRAFVELLFKRRSNNIPHVFGLELEVKGEQIVIKHKDGRPLSDSETVRVATSDFLAKGGEGTDQIFGTAPVEVLELDMREALVKHLQAGYRARN